MLASGISPGEITIMLPDDHVYGIYGVVKKRAATPSPLSECGGEPDLVE
ncbi:hypothetical protein HMPREF0290_0782 [Corynebacterium efficiens YS-314]|nr:hypothetical protein [Corynebacterium efficiens]EEW50592.1 hypothetical protein HMPREF0290_0782 [Corynebacterium efficiens YS-314]